MTEDESLRERFAALFRARYAELCHFVLQFVHSRPVAEELVQDLFLRIWERRQSWEEELPSRSYLYQAARNRALDHLKHEGIAERASAYHPDEDEALTPDVDQQLDAEDLRTALHTAIEQLPDRTRQVFILCKGHSLTYPEVAEALGISVKTVEAQMGRAFRILRGRLKKYL